MLALRSVLGVLGLWCAQMGATFAQAVPELKFPPEISQSFAREGIERTEWSAYALPLEPFVSGSKRPVALGHAERDLYNPASVMKLFTTGYAFEVLGTGHSFKTQFIVQQEAKNGILNGPLYIKGFGNPVFLTTDLWDNLRRLRALGIQRIQGNVILDRSEFQAERTTEANSPAEDFDEAAYRAYHAQPDALLMNHGAMGLDIQVNDGRVTVSSAEAPPSWTFVSQLQGTKGECGAWKNSLAVNIKRNGRDPVVTLSGNYPLRCGAGRLPIRIAQQDWLWESWFREIWAQLGGELSGQVVNGLSPANGVVVLTHQSKPVAELTKEINKWSNNVMARHFELAVAKNQAEFDARLKTWLGQLRIGTTGWVFENGSGLSRQTRIDAKGMTEFLAYMATRADFPDYMSSLPRVGVDGTLAKRMKSVEQSAYLKSGSLNGVRTVAGYVRSKNGQMWAVAIFVRSANAAQAWDPMENLVKLLYNWGS